MRVEITRGRSSPVDPDTLWVDELPTEWRLARLGEVSASSKESINPNAYADELFEYYSIPAFQETREPLITPGREILSQKLLVADGTVLFGKLNPRVPKVWRVRARTPYRKLASTEFLAMSPSDHVDGDFLTFLCWSSHVMEVSRSLVGGSTPSRQRVDPLSFYEIQVPVPPLAEQRVIAAVLAKIQAAIEMQQKIVGTLKELKAATMAKLFREGLRGELLKQTEIGEIPESWDVVRLDQAIGGHIIYGYSVSIPAAADSHGVPIISTADITKDGYILYEQVRRITASDRAIARARLADGDVLFNWRNSPELVGKTAIFQAQSEPHIFASFILGLRCDPEKANNYFIAYLLNLYREKGVFLTLARRAVNQSNYNASLIAALSIPRASLEEQAEIAGTLRRLDEGIRLETDRLRSRKILFSTMLHLLMTGQVRVPLKPLVSGQKDDRQADHTSPGIPVVGISGELPEGLEPFVAELVQRFEPERVILFGSHADGSATPDSDVDLLVVMPFEGGGRDQAAYMDSMLERSFPLDLLVRRPEEVARAVERGDAFVTGILERGRALYVRPGAADLSEAAPRQERPPHRGMLSEETLREIVQRIVETVHPEKIILFGSAARGEMGPDSDVDLLVVKSGVHRRELAARLYRELADLPVPKDIVVAAPEDLERHRDTIGLVYRAALRDGRVVYAAA